MKKTLLLSISIASCLSVLAQTPIEVNWLSQGYPATVYYGFEQPGDSVYEAINHSQIGNIWQIGHPQKTTFSAAIYGQNSLVTDTINTYPVNNVSSFQMKIINYGAYLCTYVQFLHRYQTTAGQDGGTIEVSHDNGLTWQNLITDSMYIYDFNCGFSNPPYTINDTVAALGKPGFSGNSNGNQYVSFNFMPRNNFSMQNDTIDLRFTFASDGVNENMDGWMIDDMQVGAIGEGIQNNSTNSQLSFFPNPSSGIFEIRGGSPMEEKLFSVYDISGKKVFSQEIKNEKIDLTFLPNGIYEAIVETEMHRNTQRIIINH
jgi:hypothetical protein